MTSVQTDVVVGLLVRDGRVLLCHRHPNRKWFPNVWDLPGGHIEPDESAEMAIRRELHEELGIHARLDSSTPYRILHPSSELRIRVWVLTGWEGEIGNLEPDEHDEIAWFNERQLQHLDLSHDQLIELLLDVLKSFSRVSVSRSPTERQRNPPHTVTGVSFDSRLH